MATAHGGGRSLNSADEAAGAVQAGLANALRSAADFGQDGQRHRRGIVYDKWPFRLDISAEYQDWILIAVCVFLTVVWCLPCLCGHIQYPCTRKFTNWVYTRLHHFFCVVTYINLIILMFTIGVLPDWTVDQFLKYLVAFLSWVFIHLEKLVVSFVILIGFFLLVRFRERIALALGMEHVTVLRWDWKDVFGWYAKKRPVEIFIWKVEGLHGRVGKVLKPNDVFIECHMGYNEPMRTRVHNNAGTACVVKESFQLNIDENASSILLTLLVKDQSLVTSAELARLMLSTRELCGIEDKTGKRRASFKYADDYFVALDLDPCGKIWIAVSPVDDGDIEERDPLVDDDTLVTC